jgi:DNA helicase INO80
MSFASILAEPAQERHTRKVSPSVQVHKAGDPPAVAPIPKVEKFEKPKLAPEKRRQTTHYDTSHNEISPRLTANGVAQPSSSKSRKTLSDRENERIIKALERIDAMDKSDVEAPGFEQDWERYILKGKKRARETATLEFQKRKVCPSYWPFIPSTASFANETDPRSDVEPSS